MNLIEFLTLLWAAKNVLLFNFIMIGAGAYVYHWEGLKNSDGSIFDSVYAAMITFLTIGYGDLTPVGLYGKITSILLGIVGASIKALERGK